MPLLFMVWDHRGTGGCGVKEQEGRQKKEDTGYGQMGKRNTEFKREAVFLLY